MQLRKGIRIFKFLSTTASSMFFFTFWRPPQSLASESDTRALKELTCDLEFVCRKYYTKIVKFNFSVHGYAQVPRAHCQGIKRFHYILRKFERILRLTTTVDKLYTHDCTEVYYKIHLKQLTTV